MWERLCKERRDFFMRTKKKTEKAREGIFFLSRRVGAENRGNGNAWGGGGYGLIRVREKGILGKERTILSPYTGGDKVVGRVREKIQASGCFKTFEDTALLG